jgi:hypothetical protein
MPIQAHDLMQVVYFPERFLSFIPITEYRIVLFFMLFLMLGMIISDKNGPSLLHEKWYLILVCSLTIEVKSFHICWSLNFTVH